MKSTYVAVALTSLLGLGSANVMAGCISGNKQVPSCPAGRTCDQEYSVCSSADFKQRVNFFFICENSEVKKTKVGSKVSVHTAGHGMVRRPFTNTNGSSLVVDVSQTCGALGSATQN